MRQLEAVAAGKQSSRHHLQSSLTPATASLASVVVVEHTVEKVATWSTPKIKLANQCHVPRAVVAVVCSFLNIFTWKLMNAPGPEFGLTCAGGTFDGSCCSKSGYWYVTSIDTSGFFTDKHQRNESVLLCRIQLSLRLGQLFLVHFASTLI